MTPIKYYRLQDIVIISYWIIITLVIVLFYRKIPYFRQILVFNTIFTITAAVVFRLIHNLSERKAITVRLFFSAVSVFSAFTSLGYIVKYINPERREDLLVAIDKRLFQGVNPVEWLQQYHNPYLTEYLQIIYASFYFIPLVLVIVLHYKRQYENLNVFLSAVLLGFYLNYFGYILVPIKSPYVIADLEKDRNILKFEEPLKGVYLAGRIRKTIEGMEKFKENCFPSGHTAISLVTLIFAFIYHRKTFYFLLPVISSIIFSTVYLRYHYVIDLIAGVGLALLVALAAPPLYSMWERKRASYFAFDRGVKLTDKYSEG